MQKNPVTNKKHEEHRTDQTKESIKHTNWEANKKNTRKTSGVDGWYVKKG